MIKQKKSLKFSRKPESFTKNPKISPVGMGFLKLLMTGGLGLTPLHISA